MELYQNLGPETHYREYKEAVLRTRETMVSPQDLEDLEAGVLTEDYFDKITQQTLYDLYQYLPRYLTCFFNSTRRKFYTWYYGVTDEGYLTGIPLLKDRAVEFLEELQSMFEFLLSNHLAIVLTREELARHQTRDKCQESHRLIHYKMGNQWQSGYTCRTLKQNLHELVNFQTVPVIRPPSPMRSPKFLQELVAQVVQYRLAQARYILDMGEYRRRYRDWNAEITYYSSKVNTLLANPVIVQDFIQFLQDSGKMPLKKEDYCQKEKFGECFRVGTKLIKEPPFLSYFREFRDANRSRLQLNRPKEPKAPKDLRSIYSNRLAYSGSLLFGNPDVDYLLLRCSCRALDLASKSSYRAVFFNGKFWQYQSRQLRRTPMGLTPSCVVD